MESLTAPNSNQDFQQLYERLERKVRTKMIQTQLVLLIHAFKCQGGCGRSKCDQFKSLVVHLRGCNNGVGCQHPFCKSSSKILEHWHRCRSTTCPVCQPLKATASNRSQSFQYHPAPQLSTFLHINDESINNSIPSTNQNPSAGRSTQDSVGPMRIKRHRSNIAVDIRKLLQNQGANLSIAKEVVNDTISTTNTFKNPKEELQFLRNRSECPVCLDRLKSVALQCGHQCCENCATFIEKCHTCRSQILLKIKLF